MSLLMFGNVFLGILMYILEISRHKMKNGTELSQLTSKNTLWSARTVDESPSCLSWWFIWHSIITKFHSCLKLWILVRNLNSQIHSKEKKLKYHSAFVLLIWLYIIFRPTCFVREICSRSTLWFISIGPSSYLYKVLT